MYNIIISNVIIYNIAVIQEDNHTNYHFVICEYNCAIKH